MPTVTALTDFEFAGRHIAAGDRPDFIPPVHCLALAREGKVSLAKATYQTREITPEAEPEPAKPKRRRYRRRDLQAETE